MSQRIISAQELLLLFDESGTPSFGAKVKSRHFIGVSVLYADVDEKHIFDTCDGPMGLSTRGPKKNSAISQSAALKLAAILSTLPITICARYINLKDGTL